MMKWVLSSLLLCAVTFCFAQKPKETTFYIGRNHFPSFYAFKMLNGIDTLPMNFTREFDLTEALGKYDSMRVDFIQVKVDGKRSKLITPTSPGKGAIVLYSKLKRGGYKPVYVHYINVRANRSQFDTEQ